MTDSDLTWERLESETVYTCPGFDVISETVRLPDGTETDFDYVAEGDSVVVLPFSTEGEVVVIEEWREPVRRVNYGLPAGGVEPDESEPATAVERELAEETGYEAGRVEHLTTVEPANGFADTVFHYFLAEGCTPTAERDLDHDESIDVTTTSFEDLLAAVREGELRDGRAALGILYYHAFQR
ncbi:NUDIX hydrolase [Halapricum desulfuricans]|uniref:NUDIX family hydrolase n=1 Tax=Halapricum desulfuricans TaxID=2841257 RepID=A0A897N633_9EURY|nr:NUDIX hydrolase [Halapricum desulfuricans]QSG05836.1 NUDIX family hydrolase [Halapricum desulfuricans]